MNKLLIGFTAGLLVGLLFAPERGAVTRERIARRGRTLKHKFDDLVDSLSEQFESVKDEVDDFAEKAKQKARTYSRQEGNTWVGDTKG